jgi:hypothetical protein
MSKYAGVKMQRTLIILENFYEDPDAIVSYARSLEYVFPYNKPNDEADGKFIYWRTSKFRSAADCPIKSSLVIRDRLEYATGERIDLDYWNLDFPLDAYGYPIPGYKKIRRGCWWNCSFHVKHWSKQTLGSGIHSHTDNDVWSAVGVDGWVGIIYLNPKADLRTGLNTWTNVDPRRQYDWMTPPENWRIVDVLAGVYNRLILHRGRLPHSGSPGWGNNIENGRLFQTFFFRTSQTIERPSVKLCDLTLS